MTSQRLHWRWIAAATAVILGVAAIVGLLLAVGNAKPAPPPAPTTQAIGAAKRQLTAATRAASFPKLGGVGGGGTTNPTPTTPTTTTTRGSGGGGTVTVPGGGGGGSGGGGSGAGTVQNSTVAVSPQPGWTLVKRDNYHLVFEDPAKHGLLGLESGSFSTAPTLNQYGQSLVNTILQGTTNAQICGKEQSIQLPNGPQGIYIPLCYTVVPTNGQAVQLYTGLLVGLSGSVGVAVKLITPANPTVFKQFVSESGNVLTTVHWKLLG